MADPKKILRTFVMCKPDAVERGLVGEIITRLENKGLRLVRMDLRNLSKRDAAEHYAEHLGKDFYQELEDYVTRGPVVPMIWEGRDAIAVVRKLVGATDSADAAAGTIRGDYAVDYTENLVHASDGEESAQKEIARFFGPDA